MLTPNLDKQYMLEHNVAQILGIDEAGRGAWAGPLAMGYFLYKLDSPYLEGVNDSKLVSKLKRTKLESDLLNQELGGVIYRSPQQIDSDGLSYCLNSIIKEIVSNYDQSNTLIIIDGNFAYDFGPNTFKIPKADSSFYSVAAASILAKVGRDRIMSEYALEYPEYSFDSHVGYGTKNHSLALQSHGVTDIHRKSFKPIAKYI